MIYKLSEVMLTIMFVCGGLLMVGLTVLAIKGFFVALLA